MKHVFFLSLSIVVSLCSLNMHCMQNNPESREEYEKQRKVKKTSLAILLNEDKENDESRELEYVVINGSRWGRWVEKVPKLVKEDSQEKNDTKE